MHEKVSRKCALSKAKRTFAPPLKVKNFLHNSCKGTEEEQKARDLYIYRHQWGRLSPSLKKSRRFLRDVHLFEWDWSEEATLLVTNNGTCCSKRRRILGDLFEKKVHLCRKKSIFPLFFFCIIPELCSKFRRGATPKLVFFMHNSKTCGIMHEKNTKKFGFFLRKHPITKTEVVNLSLTSRVSFFS